MTIVELEIQDRDLPNAEIQYQYLRQTVLHLPEDKNDISYKPSLTWGKMVDTAEGSRFAATSDGYGMNMVLEPDVPSLAVNGLELIQFQESAFCEAERLKYPDFKQFIEHIQQRSRPVVISTSYAALKQLATWGHESGYFHFVDRDVYVVNAGVVEGVEVAQMVKIGELTSLGNIDGGVLKEPQRWYFSVKRILKAVHPAARYWEISLPIDPLDPIKLASFGGNHHFCAYLMPMNAKRNGLKEDELRVAEMLFQAF